MKIKYFWKYISDDGLLKDIEPCGPYYEQDSLNVYGYDSEEEAINDYEGFKKRNQYSYNAKSEVTLVKIYDFKDN